LLNFVIIIIGVTLWSLFHRKIGNFLEKAQDYFFVYPNCFHFVSKFPILRHFFGKNIYNIDSHIVCPAGFEWFNRARCISVVNGNVTASKSGAVTNCKSLNPMSTLFTAKTSHDETSLRDRSYETLIRPKIFRTIFFNLPSFGQIFNQRQQTNVYLIILD
jgi:hypothetical protein